MAAPTNNSLRFELIKQITDYLQSEVNPDNGYKNNLKDHVMRGIAVHSASTMALPAVSVYEGVNSQIAEQGHDASRVGGNEDPSVLYGKYFMISGWTRAQDKNNPTDEVYELMADVKKAFGKLITKLGEGEPIFSGIVTSMEIDPGVVLPREDPNMAPQFVLRIVPNIVESLVDPYRIDS